MRWGTRNGFTLVETVVVIAITIFLTATTLVYNRSSEKQIALLKDQAVVVGVLNRAKGLTLQKFFKKGTGSACAMGVHFSPPEKSLTIFQDLDTDSDPSNGCGDGKFDNTKEEFIETVVLDRRIVLVEIPSAGNILFRPPYLEAVNAGVVTIQAEGTNQTRRVKVTAGGEISAE